MWSNDTFFCLNTKPEEEIQLWKKSKKNLQTASDFPTDYHLYLVLWNLVVCYVNFVNFHLWNVKFFMLNKLMLHRKRSFSLRISAVNVTKPAVFYGFGHNNWRTP